MAFQRKSLPINLKLGGGRRSAQFYFIRQEAAHLHQ